MAPTSTKTSAKKSKPKRSSSSSRAKAKTSNGSKAKASNGSKSTKPTKSRPKASKRSSGSGSRNGSSAGVSAGIQSARETVEDVGAKAGKATTNAASKAKVPLIAGGAALVGAASGIALNSARSSGSKVLGVKLPKTKVKINSKDLAKAADRVAGAGEGIGKLSTGIRELQGTGAASNGDGQHRSPIEVLVQGLTRRR